MDAIRIGREVMSHLDWSKEGNSPDSIYEEPINDQEDLLGIESSLKRPFDVREVISRIADGSRFEEFKPLFGPTIICGFMKIHGHTVGVWEIMVPYFQIHLKRQPTLFNYAIR